MDRLDFILVYKMFWDILVYQLSFFASRRGVCLSGACCFRNQTQCRGAPRARADVLKLCAGPGETQLTPWQHPLIPPADHPVAAGFN